MRKIILGHKVKTLVGWSGVPIGTFGTIVDIDQDGSITVEWDGLGTQLGETFKPLRDGFRMEELGFLEFI